MIRCLPAATISFGVPLGLLVEQGFDGLGLAVDRPGLETAPVSGGLEARWPNGVQLQVRAIELCPEGGADPTRHTDAPTDTTQSRPSLTTNQAAFSDALTPMDLSVRDSTPPLSPRQQCERIEFKPAAPPISPDTRVAVEVVQRQSSETWYSFVVPGCHEGV
jgi:hypothetical protein